MSLGWSESRRATRDGCTHDEYGVHLALCWIASRHVDKRTAPSEINDDGQQRHAVEAGSLELNQYAHPVLTQERRKDIRKKGGSCESHLLRHGKQTLGA